MLAMRAAAAGLGGGARPEGDGKNREAEQGVERLGLVQRFQNDLAEDGAFHDSSPSLVLLERTLARILRREIALMRSTSGSGGVFPSCGEGGETPPLQGLF